MQIKYMFETKYLGLHLTENLKCYVNIKHLSSNWTEDINEFNYLKKSVLCKFSFTLEVWHSPQLRWLQKTTKESNQLIINLERVTSGMEWFKTLNILPLPFTHTMEVVYYIKFNIGKLELNLVMHDYNSCQLPDLQTQFFIFSIKEKKENNMGIKLFLD